MKIALDYDETFTKDPEFWLLFCSNAGYVGHDVRIVTARHETLDKISPKMYEKGILSFVVPIIYCNGVAKRFYCMHFANWEPDIWIDDKPHSIDENSKATNEWLKEWRETREAA